MKKQIGVSVLVVVIVSCVTVFSGNLYATIYYDIDFSSPEHTVGQPPSTGPSITTPSKIVFGQPVVSESLGALENQPLVFNCHGNSPQFYYDQIKLDMDYGTGFYYTSFDVLTQNLIGSRNRFTILFDTPTVQNITFQNNGKVNLFWRKEINYLDNEPLHFEISMNIAKKQTRIVVNGNKVYKGSFSPKEYLRSIRFSHGLGHGNDPPDYSSFVGIDNIFIADFVPEPSTSPVADADGPYSIYVGDILTLDASDSTDADGDIVSYMWDLDDNGSFETDAGGYAIFDVNYAELQSLGLIVDHTYNIYLKVTDSEEQNDVNDTTITILPKPALEVAVDNKPRSCPNPVNVKSSGVLPVAVLGTEEFDVSTIDPTSVRLAGVDAIRSSYEDVARPASEPCDCNCTTDGPDGFLDLTLKFKTQEIVEAIGEVNDSDVLSLTLTGVLFEERPIEGADCILVRGKYKPFNKADINKDGVVDLRDFSIFAENWLKSSIVED